jgi:uncharacterized membrane protein YciS (DUF1049 family)
MTFVKWAVVFIIAFALAFVIIVTFSQPQFKQTASAVIFTYQTKSLPLYLYVAGALFLGLIVGCSLAAYYYITLRATVFKRDRQIKKLEEDLSIAVSSRPAQPGQVEPAGPSEPGAV